MAIVPVSPGDPPWPQPATADRRRGVSRLPLWEPSGQVLCERERGGSTRNRRRFQRLVALLRR